MARKGTSKKAAAGLHKSAGAVVAQPPESDTTLQPEVSRREKIQLLAYNYWLERGCQDGSPEEDWFRAEREVDILS